MDALSGLRRRWKRSGLEAFARRHERALLLAVLCLSVMAPLVKYMALSDHWDSSIEIHRASSGHGGGTAGPEPADDAGDVSSAQDPRLTFADPIICDMGERELARWNQCNRKKFKPIRSCRRAAGKCVVLPLYKQKLTPFCSECLNDGKKLVSGDALREKERVHPADLVAENPVLPRLTDHPPLSPSPLPWIFVQKDDCFREAETYAMTQRRCVKAREAVKRKQCEVPAGEDSFHHRVRRECMVATTKIAASAAEVARMRRIVPRAFELVERQERQQRRGRSKRARRAAERLASTNSGGGGNGAGQEPPAAAQPDGNKIEYGQVEISSRPEYPTLDLEGGDDEDEERRR